MSGVIKVRHTSDFAQIHNAPLQSDLDSLQSIGLLAHLMSLPESWEIHKTQLHKKFTRRTVDSAWKELAEKGYIVGFDIYVSGRKKSFYSVSDQPFTINLFKEVIEAHIEDLERKLIRNNISYTLKTIKPMPGNILEIPEKLAETYNKDEKESNVQNVQQSNAQNVQYKMNSTERTYINIDLKNTDLETKKEEEEETSSIINFLINKDIPEKNAIQFAKRVIELSLTGYTKEDIMRALSLAYDDFKKGKCNELYLWAAGKLQRILEAKTLDKIENNAKESKKSFGNRKIIKKDIVPAWMQENKEDQEQKYSTNDFEEEKKRLEAELQQYKQSIDNDSIQL